MNRQTDYFVIMKNMLVELSMSEETNNIIALDILREMDCRHVLDFDCLSAEMIRKLICVLNDYVKICDINRDEGWMYHLDQILKVNLSRKM